MQNQETKPRAHWVYSEDKQDTAYNGSSPQIASNEEQREQAIGMKEPKARTVAQTQVTHRQMKKSWRKKNTNVPGRSLCKQKTHQQNKNSPFVDNVRKKTSHCNLTTKPESSNKNHKSKNLKNIEAFAKHVFVIKISTKF